MIEELYEIHGGALRRFAFSMTRDDGEAEDLVQETFVRALSNSELLKILDLRKRRSWLFTVLKNCHIDRIRHDKHEISFGEDSDLTQDDAPDCILDAATMTANLSHTLRNVVFKSYWLGMNSTEIARDLGIPSATVRFRLRLALRLLKSKFSTHVKETL